MQWRLSQKWTELLHVLPTGYTTKDRRQVHGITIADLLERSAERESRSMYHI